MREATERKEAMDVGSLKLVGVNVKAILTEVTYLLSDLEGYHQMSKKCDLYGDGMAAERIANILENDFLSKRTATKGRSICYAMSE